MNSTKVNWIDMFPDEFHSAMKRRPVCYMAYGPAEPHGAYNTMGIDWVGTQLFTEAAAKKFGGIVAPPFVWHIAEQPYHSYETQFAGMGMSITSSIPESLFLHNMLYHIRSMDTKGFHAGILLSGHYMGGLGHDMRLLCDMYKQRTGSPIQFYAATTDEIVEIEASAEHKRHAGVIETAQFMYLKPDGVDLDRLNREPNVPREIAGGAERFGYYCAPKGFEKDAELVTAELGKQIVEKRLCKIGDIVSELLDNYEKEQKERKVVSITETEELWTRFEMLTRKYWQCVLTKSEKENKITPPPFPGWKEMTPI